MKKGKKKKIYPMSHPKFFVEWRRDCPWIIKGLPFKCMATGLPCRRGYCAPILLIEKSKELTKEE